MSLFDRGALPKAVELVTGHSIAPPVATATIQQRPNQCAGSCGDATWSRWHLQALLSLVAGHQMTISVDATATIQHSHDQSECWGLWRSQRTQLECP